MLMRCSPHHTNIGKRELRQMPTAMRRLCGQSAIGPRGVEAQSKSRTREPISLVTTLSSGCEWGTGGMREDSVAEGIGPMGGGKVRLRSEKLAETVERGWILRQDALARRFSTGPFREEVQ